MDPARGQPEEERRAPAAAGESPGGDCGTKSALHGKEATRALLRLPREPAPPFILKVGARMALGAMQRGWMRMDEHVVERDADDFDGQGVERKLREKIVGQLFDPVDVRREVCRLAGARFREDDGEEEGGEAHDGTSEVYHISMTRISARIRRVGACALERAVTERLRGADGAPADAVDVTDMFSCRLALIEALVGNLLMSRARRAAPRALLERERVDRPIVVLGLPRTGTTFLFDLLHAHGAVRAPRNYEATWPVLPDTVCGHEYRYKGYLFSQMMFIALSEMHAEELTSPCELNRIAKHALGGLSWHLEMFGFLREYDRWWYGSRGDVDDDWQFFRSQLQTMQAMRRASELRARRGPLGLGALRCFGGARDDDGEEDAPAPRWLLKDPELSMMEHICRNFPGATIVVTHRNLTKALPSLFSMRERVQQASARGSVFAAPRRDFYEHFIRDQVQAHLGDMRDFRERARDDPSLLHGCEIVDVRFPDLVDRPVDACERIFCAAGLAFPDEARERVRAAVDANSESRSTTRRHVYSCADFGLDREALAARFEEYHRAYDL